MTDKSAAAQPHYQLRHRLTGAVLVVSAAALGIPLLLPAPNSGEYHEGGAQVVSFEIGGNIRVSDRALDQIIDPIAPPPGESGDEQVPVPPVSETGEWKVSVGVFGNSENAGALRIALAKHGFHPHITPIKTREGKDATRVWLGPYADEKTAREVAETLNLLTGEKGQALDQARRR